MSTMHSAQSTITAAVEELRHARHETQADLAEVLGVSDPGVSRRLTGRTRWTSDDLDALARHFAVPLARLVAPVDQRAQATLPYRAPAGQEHLARVIIFPRTGDGHRHGFVAA